MIPKEDVVELITNLGEVLLLGRAQIEAVMKKFKEWGESLEIKKIIMEHPLLLLNYPYEVLPFKERILRHFKFTTKMTERILRDFP